MSDTMAVKVFENNQFGKVRTVSIGGEPWFVANDVFRVLSVSNSKDALHTLDDDEKSGVDIIDPHGRTQKTNCISEAGLYSIILRSRKPEAKLFKRWVTHEVIPSIRKHGVYAVDEVLNNPDMLIGALQALKKERAEKALLQPKADYYDKVLQAPDAMPVTLIAKECGMTAYQLNKILSDMKVQYKTGGTWTLYKEYQNEGYTKMRTYYDCYGRARNEMQWTQKGRHFLHTILQKQGKIPSVKTAVFEW